MAKEEIDKEYIEKNLLERFNDIGRAYEELDDFANELRREGVPFKTYAEAYLSAIDESDAPDWLKRIGIKSIIKTMNQVKRKRANKKYWESSTA